jgi:hypothetical protein
MLAMAYAPVAAAAGAVRLTYEVSVEPAGAGTMNILPVLRGSAMPPKRSTVVVTLGNGGPKIEAPSLQGAAVQADLGAGKSLLTLSATRQYAIAPLPKFGESDDKPPTSSGRVRTTSIGGQSVKADLYARGTVSSSTDVWVAEGIDAPSDALGELWQTLMPYARGRTAGLGVPEELDVYTSAEGGAVAGKSVLKKVETGVSFTVSLTPPDGYTEITSSTQAPGKPSDGEPTQREDRVLEMVPATHRLRIPLTSCTELA